MFSLDLCRDHHCILQAVARFTRATKQKNKEHNNVRTTTSGEAHRALHACCCCAHCLRHVFLSERDSVSVWMALKVVHAVYIALFLLEHCSRHRVTTSDPRNSLPAKKTHQGAAAITGYKAALWTRRGLKASFAPMVRHGILPKERVSKGSKQAGLRTPNCPGGFHVVGL